MDAWTGTQSNGIAASDGITPGDEALGQWSSSQLEGPEIGCGVFQTSWWLGVEQFSTNQVGESQALSLYALSSVVTVPETVPEPSVLLLLAVGSVGLLAIFGRRRRLPTP